MLRAGLDALARALNDNITAISGAKLRFKRAGTSVLQSVYDSPTLNNSLGPVITADAAGVFPQFWFNSTWNYDAELLNPDNTLRKALPNIFRRTSSLILLEANATLYVDPSTGDDNDDGLSEDSALRTVTAAYSKARDQYHLNGKQLVLKLPDECDFDEVAIVSGLCTGWRDLNSLIIRGNVSAPAECHNLHAGIYPAMSVYEMAMVRIEGMKFSNPNGNDHCMKAYRQAYVELGEVALGKSGRTCIQGAQGWIVSGTRAGVAGKVYFQDDAQQGCVSEVDGGIDFSFGTVTFSAGVEFSGHPKSAFVDCGEGAYFGCHGTTWVGTFTGRKYYNSNHGTAVPIDGLELIPGSIEGAWATSDLSEPQCRLTLTNGVPYTTADVTAATTIHYEPDAGDFAPFSVAGVGVFEMVTIGAAGLSLALDSNSGHTGYHQSGKNFDLFLIVKPDGTQGRGAGPAWTSDTVRATDITRPNGVPVNATSMTARYGSGTNDYVTVAANVGAWVGTFRASANGQTEDSDQNRLLWNAWRRRTRRLSKNESTSHSYATGTYRPWNNSAAGAQVTWVCGEAGPVDLRWQAEMTQASASSQPYVAPGIDSTTAALDFQSAITFNVAAGATISLGNSREIASGLGYHYACLLEFGGATGTPPTFVRASLSGALQG